MVTCLRAMGSNSVPCQPTQVTAPTSILSNRPFIHPTGMEGWVALGGWLYTEMFYLSEDLTHVVVVAHQLLFSHHASSWLRKWHLMMLEMIREEWGRGDTESFEAVVSDGLHSSVCTDVNMPCQGLLSTFFQRRANQPAVGSTTKRWLHQNQTLSIQVVTNWDWIHYMGSWSKVQHPDRYATKLTLLTHIW